MSDLPPADEDEDALLQRILAEGEAEKAAAQAAAQESFATPLQKVNPHTHTDAHTNLLTDTSGNTRSRLWSFTLRSSRQTHT